MSMPVERIIEEIPEELRGIDEVLKGYGRKSEMLIPALQKVQEEFGYLPEEGLKLVSRRLGVPLSKVFGVASFYAQFHLEPRGKYVIRVCLGTACHVRGGERILKDICDHLQIEPGGTTEDLLFTLERVACLGACGMAPAMMVNEKTYGRLTSDEVTKILEGYRSGF